MRLLKKFWKNSDGSLAIQLSLLILPLLGCIGVAVDYSRVAVVKTSLQSTLDNDVRSMPYAAFNNRVEMEKYIVAMAKVNQKSDSIASQISITKDKIRIDLRDTVKTPILSIVGKPEVYVIASVEIEQATAPTDGQKTTSSTTFASTKKSTDLNRTQINEMKQALRKRLARIKAYKNLSPERKRRYVRALTSKLEKLKAL